MLEIGERHNTMLVKSVANIVVPRFNAFLDQASRLPRQQILARLETGNLDRFIRDQVNDLAVLKVKIFSANGKTVYSTDAADIGIVRDKSYLEWSAMREGRPVSHLEYHESFQSLLGSVSERYVLSTYVPVSGLGAGKNDFVIEFYTDVTPDLSAIGSVQITMISGSAFVLFLVFIVMYLAARRADSVIDIEAELSRDAMESSNRLGRILDQSVNEIYVFTVDSLQFVQVNRGACQNLGYTEQELRSMTPYDIKPEYDEQSFRAAIRPLLTGEKKQMLFETRHQRKDGSIYPVEVRLQLSRAGESPLFVAMIMDITERKAAEDRISFLAYHDELTELPNRNLFLDRLQQAIYDADREESLVGVMFLDLDRFKTINDSLGHTVGDQLLVQAGKRLQKLLRAGDSIARLGGDEFSIVITGIKNVVDCTRIADKVREAMTRPFQIGGRELVVTASIGITMYPFDDNEIHGLLKNADIAMYNAKETGRDNYQFYSASMAEAAAERLGVELSMRQALAQNQFVLHYQPILDLREKRIVGVETLVRWQHPERGLIGPDTFIPIAEETGLIVQLGDWVLRTACEHARALGDMDLQVPRVAVNLSPRQFQDPSLVAGLRKIFRETAFDPSKLDFEITESLLMDNIDAVNRQLNELTDIGIRLSIDDFGTGYSSLSYLRKLPITNLKIDRSFVDELPENADDAAIVSSIISMAHYLGMKTIAEGVETEAQLKFLQEAGCDIAQGYLISKPLPLERLRKFIKENQAPSEAQEKAV